MVWRFPTAEAVPDGVSTEEQGSTSTLRLHNASWSQAGRYACEEPSSRQTKSLDVFIPGHGKKTTTKKTDTHPSRCAPSSPGCKRFALFPPPVGPEEWFVPGGGGTVTKVGEEGTIPCAVSDPRLNVSLYERDGREPVGAVRYHAAQGFSGPLNDSPYRCVARGDGQEKTSRTYYVFSIIGPLPDPPINTLIPLDQLMH